MLHALSLLPIPAISATMPEIMPAACRGAHSAKCMEAHVGRVHWGVVAVGVLLATIALSGGHARKGCATTMIGRPSRVGTRPSISSRLFLSMKTVAALFD
jgi:hypothetical protein